MLTSSDSWIEISSQPSSTSLCSQDNNEIVTTGLNVRPGRRQLRLDNIGPRSAARSTSVEGSSQDEYEESESDSDRIMSSSNEDVRYQPEEEDETATTLGIDTRNVFTPQPNAFSHPPQPGNTRSIPTPNSYFPVDPPTASSHRLPSNRMITPQTITHRSIRRDQISSSSSKVTPDHDAALRASLTTLLSCAAAVRPVKDTKERSDVISSARSSTQPTTLRLVPESELDTNVRPQKHAPKRRSRESSKERTAKKVRALRNSSSNEEVLSPTVMTWMISAGVVLVFSAISFSAGYAWGKEVGRVEGELGLVGGNCGSEALRGSGLRKLRWSAAPQSVRA